MVSNGVCMYVCENPTLSLLIVIIYNFKWLLLMVSKGVCVYVCENPTLSLLIVIIFKELF